MKKTTHRSHNWWNWSASNSVHYLVVFFFVCVKKKGLPSEYENNVSHHIENIVSIEIDSPNRMNILQYIHIFLPFVINQIKLIVGCTGKLPLFSVCAHYVDTYIHTGLDIECVTTMENDTKTITLDRKQRWSKSTMQQQQHSNEDVFFFFLLRFSFSVCSFCRVNKCDGVYVRWIAIHCQCEIYQMKNGQTKRKKEKIPITTTEGIQKAPFRTIRWLCTFIFIAVHKYIASKTQTTNIWNMKKPLKLSALWFDRENS